MYKVEKGITRPSGKYGPTKYPFFVMEVGDSFEVPIEKKNSIYKCASSYGKRHGQKFSVRKFDDATYRCWRVE